MLKLVLFYKIRKLYNIFGEVLNSNFINKLSDITYDNLGDVLFDINEVRGGYELEYDEDEMTTYLNDLYTQIEKFRDKSPLALNSVLFNICNTKKNGFYELRRGTAPIYKLAQYLYKKGVI